MDESLYIYLSSMDLCSVMSARFKCTSSKGQRSVYLDDRVDLLVESLNDAPRTLVPPLFVFYQTPPPFVLTLTIGQGSSSGQRC